MSEPAPAVSGTPPEPLPGILPSEDTRIALWEEAGLVRDAAGLERLTSDAHPLARRIGRSALERRESRGCHIRADFAGTDAALDDRHLIVRSDQPDLLERWD
jgi:aspartate oxidase